VRQNHFIQHEQVGGSAQKKLKNSGTTSKTPLSSPGFTAVEHQVEEMVGSPHIELEPEEAATDFPSAFISLNPEVQLSNYAIQMLCSAEIRNWTVAYLIQGNFLTLWYYDRTRAISTIAIEFKEPKEGKKLFILFIIALTKCSMRLDKLGFSEKFNKKTDDPIWPRKLYGPEPAEYWYLHFNSCEAANIHIPSDDAGVSDLLNRIPAIDIDKASTIARIEISNPVHRQLTLFGRATRVENVVLGTNDNGTFKESTAKGSYDAPFLVMKISYQVCTRELEHIIIQTARLIDKRHTPAVLACLVWDENLPGDTLIDNQEKKPVEDYCEKRRTVALIMRKYGHIWDLPTNFDKTITVLRQVIICE